MMTIVLYWDVNYKGIEREKWRVRAFNNYEVKKWFITHMWFKALFLIVTFAKWIKKFNAANFVHWNDEKLLPVAPTTPPHPSSSPSLLKAPESVYMQTEKSRPTGSMKRKMAEERRDLKVAELLLENNEYLIYHNSYC